VDEDKRMLMHVEELRTSKFTCMTVQTSLVFLFRSARNPIIMNMLRHRIRHIILLMVIEEGLLTLIAFPCHHVLVVIKM